jgi:3-oxoacyl-[acyl-carrier protein] reductase
MKVMITGTRTGIGRSLAEHLLAAGHEVIGCSRGRGAIQHARYDHRQVDLTDSAAVRAVFRDLRRTHGHLDALVNNAGTSVMNHFMLTPEHTTRRLFDLNFFAVLNCCREAVKLLRRSRQATTAILALSTVAVPWALDGHLAYSSSKAAVEQLVRVMSKELADHRVRVNGLGIPPVGTVLTRSVPRALIDGLIARQAIKRQCTYDDLTGPVEFLIGQQSGFVTGETIFLGGVS